MSVEDTKNSKKCDRKSKGVSGTWLTDEIFLVLDVDIVGKCTVYEQKWILA